MRKEFIIDRFAYYPQNRKANTLKVTIDLSNNKDNMPVFSGHCELWNSKNTDILMGGQAFDSILEYFPELQDNTLFMKIYRLWKKNHCNDMDASANDAQREAVEEYFKENSYYDYGRVCDFLKKRNLFEVEVDGRMCKYGYEWYYRPIPQDDMKEILDLLSM